MAGVNHVQHTFRYIESLFLGAPTHVLTRPKRVQIYAYIYCTHNEYTPLNHVHCTHSTRARKHQRTTCAPATKRRVSFVIYTRATNPGFPSACVHYKTVWWVPILAYAVRYRNGKTAERIIRNNVTNTSRRAISHGYSTTHWETVVARPARLCESIHNIILLLLCNNLQCAIVPLTRGVVRAPVSWPSRVKI